MQVVQNCEKMPLILTKNATVLFPFTFHRKWRWDSGAFIWLYAALFLINTWRWVCDLHQILSKTENTKKSSRAWMAAGLIKYWVCVQLSSLPIFSFTLESSFFSFMSKSPESLLTQVCNIILNISQTDCMANVSTGGDHRNLWIWPFIL